MVGFNENNRRFQGKFDPHGRGRHWSPDPLLSRILNNRTCYGRGGVVSLFKYIWPWFLKLIGRYQLLICWSVISWYQQSLRQNYGQKLTYHFHFQLGWNQENPIVHVWCLPFCVWEQLLFDTFISSHEINIDRCCKSRSCSRSQLYVTAFADK